MKLELGTFHIKDLILASKTHLDKGTLYVNSKELRDLLFQDSNFSDVELDIAKPGEMTRIVHALDVIEPRIKVDGPGSIFPGFLGPCNTVGRGRTHRLSGMAVVETRVF